MPKRAFRNDVSGCRKTISGTAGSPAKWHHHRRQADRFEHHADLTGVRSRR